MALELRNGEFKEVARRVERPTDLRSDAKVRVVLDGMTFYLPVKGIANAPALACLEALNAARAVGPCIGLACTFLGHNVQIDVT